MNLAYHLPRAVLANWYYGFPARKLSVTAVTGTDGKTTTVWGLHHLCQIAGSQSAMISTVKTVWPGHQADTGLHVTTPDEWQMQLWLSQMVAAGADSLVLEVSSHGIDQHRIWGVKPEVAVLTNIARDHLDYHANWHDYRQTKAKLFVHVPRIVINPKAVKDWSWWQDWLARFNPQAKIMTYGLQPEADVSAQEIEYTDQGISFTLVQQDFQRRIRLPLYGQHNLLNALAVVAAGRQWRIRWPVIVKALRTYPAIPGRWQILKLPGNRRVVVDFAHTPQGIQAILGSIHQHFPQQAEELITVLGSASQRDAGKRPDMGYQAMTKSRYVIVTEDDSRNEPRETIMQQIAQGCLRAGGQMVTRKQLLAHESSGFVLMPDRRQAIKLALQAQAAGSLVALLGKGHEQSLAVKGQEIPWSDFRVAKQLADKIYN